MGFRGPVVGAVLNGIFYVFRAGVPPEIFWPVVAANPIFMTRFHALRGGPNEGLEDEPVEIPSVIYSIFRQIEIEIPVPCEGLL